MVLPPSTLCSYIRLMVTYWMVILVSDFDVAEAARAGD